MSISEGVYVARIHVQMRNPDDALPDVADLHDLLRWQLEGPEIDSTLGLTFDDLIDPSSVRITKVELTRLHPQAPTELERLAEAIPDHPTDAEAQLWLARIRDRIGRP